MDTLLLAVILTLGLHYSTGQSLDPGIDTDNAEVQKLIYDKHNALRRSVDPPASDMEKMVWNKEAAANAKKVAEKCIPEHSSDEERTIGTSISGENLYKRTKPVSWEKVIQIWFDENKNFKYGVGATSPEAMTGHYTQVVWNTSSTVGCASHQCLGFVLYYCQYTPSGNYEDRINKPYTSGTPCGTCPRNCENGLCNSEYAVLRQRRHTEDGNEAEISLKEKANPGRGY